MTSRKYLILGWLIHMACIGLSYGEEYGLRVCNPTTYTVTLHFNDGRAPMIIGAKEKLSAFTDDPDTYKNLVKSFSCFHFEKGSFAPIEYRYRCPAHLEGSHSDLKKSLDAQMQALKGSDKPDTFYWIEIGIVDPVTIVGTVTREGSMGERLERDMPTLRMLTLGVLKAIKRRY